MGNDPATMLRSRSAISTQRWEKMAYLDQRSEKLALTTLPTTERGWLTLTLVVTPRFSISTSVKLPGCPLIKTRTNKLIML